jgi:queuosine precursor transporter
MEGGNSLKRNTLFIVLAGIFITNAILAEIVGVKLFSLEKTLGIEALSLHLFDSTALGLNFTAGVILWPFVFITTDIINEYFGRQGVHRISFLAAGLISYAFIMLFFVTRLSPSDYWLSLYEKTPNGHTFDINYAFSLIFSQGMAIIVASLTAFLVGQLIDVYIFTTIRKYTGNKYLWLRATGSTLVSQLIDSFVVLFLAFYVLQDEAHRWSLPLLFSVGVLNYIYKFVVALALTPLLYVAHYLIDRYLQIAPKNQD